MATTTDRIPSSKTPAPHQRDEKISATPQRSSPVVGLRGIPAVRLTPVVDRTAKLSDEVLKSVDEGQRAAIEALGRFLVALEEALPQEVQGTSDVAKKITEAGLQFLVTIEEALSQEVQGTSEVAKKVTESGLEMADRLVQTQYEFLRKVIDSIAKSLRNRNGAKPHTD